MGNKRSDFDFAHLRVCEVLFHLFLEDGVAGDLLALADVVGDERGGRCADGGHEAAGGVLGLEQLTHDG